MAPDFRAKPETQLTPLTLMRSRQLAALFCIFATAAQAATPRAADREALRKTMESVIEKSSLKSARVTIQVRSLDDGAVVFSRDPDELLNPASNVKLFTAATAISRLGPEYRFETEFLVDPEFKDGKAKILYVRGRGDPSITTERLYGMVSELLHAGLKEVQDDRGRRHLVRRRAAAARLRPGIRRQGLPRAHRRALAQLEHRGRLPAPRRAGRRQGHHRGRASVGLLRGRRRGGHRHQDPAPLHGQLGRGQGQDAPEDRSQGRGAGRQGHLVGVEEDRSARAVLRLHPQVVAGAARGQGEGAAARGHGALRPEDAAHGAERHARHRAQAPQQALLELRGRAADQDPGRRGARGAGQPRQGHRRGGRLPRARGGHRPRQLRDEERLGPQRREPLLGRADHPAARPHDGASFQVMPEFISSVGIAGKDGTLKYRFEGSDAVGRLRAKTGTLETVSALSGYVAVGGRRALRLLHHGQRLRGPRGHGGAQHRRAGRGRGGLRFHGRPLGGGGGAHPAHGGGPLRGAQGAAADLRGAGAEGREAQRGAAAHRVAQREGPGGARHHRRRALPVGPARGRQRARAARQRAGQRRRLRAHQEGVDGGGLRSARAALAGGAGLGGQRRRGLAPVRVRPRRRQRRAGLGLALGAARGGRHRRAPGAAARPQVHPRGRSRPGHRQPGARPGEGGPARGAAVGRAAAVAGRGRPLHGRLRAQPRDHPLPEDRRGQGAGSAHGAHRAPAHRSAQQRDQRRGPRRVS